MAIWLIRAGSHGEYEQKFIQEKRVYVTWDELDVNLAKLQHRTELTAAMTERYPDSKPKRIQNWVSQIWPFAHEMRKGDLVILPLKTQPAICVGEVTSDYHSEESGLNPFYHWRPVEMDRGSHCSRQFQPGFALYVRRVFNHLPRGPQ